MPHAPYGDTAVDHLYHLLFCDDREAFAPRRGQAASDWQKTLFGAAPDAAAVRRLAEDTAGDARVRALAYGWLRGQGREVAARQLLGVVLEVPTGQGLDVLAAYADGGVRYLHQSGRASIVEGPLPALMPVVTRLMAASQQIVDRIGPWDKPRLAPPQRNVRMTFVVSDGLYFGEGPMQTLMGDAMAGPVLNAGIELLQRVVDLSLPKAA